MGIGVHLNLAEGQPVASARNIPSLVDPNGRLHWSPGSLLRALVARKVNLAEIETELRAQIGKVFAAGIRPTHLDGHKHVHLLPGVRPIVIRLAQEFAIPAIRCPREVAPNLAHLLSGRSSRTGVAKQYLVGARRFCLRPALSRRAGEGRAALPRTLLWSQPDRILARASVLDILGSLPEGVSELMCHPGYLDGDLVRSGTRLLGQREVEIRALTAPPVRRLVADRGIELISYEQLGIDAAPHTSDTNTRNKEI